MHFPHHRKGTRLRRCRPLRILYYIPQYDIKETTKRHIIGLDMPIFRGFTTKSFQKRTIGALFPSPTTPYCRLTFSMVNMPQPSYYMIYNSAESYFRHLQILEAYRSTIS
jgi:hypothetical protein